MEAITRIVLNDREKTHIQSTAFILSQFITLNNDNDEHNQKLNEIARDAYDLLIDFLEEYTGKPQERNTRFC